MNPLVPEVQAKVISWRPANSTEADLGAVEPLLPTVRAWVELARPREVRQAARYMRAAVGIAEWADRSLGTLDPTVVLDPRNVEYWSMKLNSHQSVRWRERTRSALRVLGRAVNPQGWPPPTQKVGRQDVARPYTPREERVFRLASRLPGRDNRARRLWVVAAALGAGLSGVEIAAAHTGDLLDIGNGRLAIEVRGRNLRLTPLRQDYTDLARASADMAATERFIGGDIHNAVHSVTRRLDPGNGQGFSLRRARSTWLTAHLVAGTPLALLRKVAGPLSANTLDGLLGYAAASTDDQTAVTGALDA
ncbi:MAG: hypothetical protein OXI56_01310 [bacterium]|nr:hypothetical protein [bacterium]MDE0600413.1 hypothetical protein [bacterium]